MQDVPTRESTDLVALMPLKAEMVFVPGGVDAILKKIADEVRAHKPDISTEAGRAAIASLAYKVARSKTALDDMGKDLVSDWKTKAAAVDVDRRKIRAGLDALKEEVRKPLTDWERADMARIEAHEQAIADMLAMLNFVEEPTAADLQALIDIHAARPARAWEEFTQRASEAAAMVGARLEKAHAAAVKREAEAAELDRLRAEKIASEQKERDDRIAAVAAESARLQAEAKAEIAAAAAEMERQAAIFRAEKAEADAKAAHEKHMRERDEAIAAAERSRLAAIEAERQRVADEKAAQDLLAKKREENKKHRAAINNEILAALVQAGVSEAAGKTVIGLIASGNCPHVKISY